MEDYKVGHMYRIAENATAKEIAGKKVIYRGSTECPFGGPRLEVSILMEDGSCGPTWFVRRSILIPLK